MGASRARQIIGAVGVVDELGSVTRVTLPVNEAQVRALNKIPEDDRAAVWERAVAEHGTTVSARQIARIAADDTPHAAIGTRRVSPEQYQCAGLSRDTIDQLRHFGIEYHGSLSRDGGATWLHSILDGDGNSRQLSARQIDTWLASLWDDAQPATAAHDERQQHQDELAATRAELDRIRSEADAVRSALVEHRHEIDKARGYGMESVRGKAVAPLLDLLDKIAGCCELRS